MKIGFIRVSLLRKAPWCPREHGEREKKKARWGLWEEKIIAVFIGIPSGSLVYELKLNASVFVITVTNMYF